MRTLNDEAHNIKIDPEKRLHRSFQDYAAAAKAMGILPLAGPATFQGNVHNPEQIARHLANAFMVQLFDASSLAPGDMKGKVLAYQEEVLTFAMHYIKEGMRSEGMRIGLMLEAAGHSAAASLVKSTQI